MRRFVAISLLALGTTLSAFAQSSSSLSEPMQSSASAPTHGFHASDGSMAPFSRAGLGAGISLMGINLQAATDLDRHLNLRLNGNVFGYSVNNINTNGFTFGGNLNLASMGVDLDYYPFPTHGFRLSPGLLLYNQNSVSATGTVGAGQSFTVNNNTYYSSASNPVHATATIGFNANNPAFTLTTGWGNIISRTGGHVSFPFEIGVAFTGAPSVNLSLPQGQVCDATGSNCVNVASDTTLQTDLQAQIAKYKNDLNVLTVYPILSFGIGFNFPIR
jgi:hypothetical protein